MQRWLLIPFIVLAGGQGLAYIFGSPERTQSPAFQMARHMLPLETWGWLFIIGAVAILLAALSDSAEMVAMSLFIGGGIYSLWFGLYLAAAVTDDDASLVGPFAWGFIAMMHFYGYCRIKVER